MGLRPIFSLRGSADANVRQTTKNPIAGLRFYQEPGSGGAINRNWLQSTTSQARDYTAHCGGSAMLNSEPKTPESRGTGAFETWESGRALYSPLCPVRLATIVPRALPHFQHPRLHD